MRRVAPLEVAPVQLVRLPLTWVAWQRWPGDPPAPRKPSTPPAGRVRQAPLTRPQPTMLRPPAHARHPTRRARHALKLRPLARQHPTPGLPEAIRLPPGSALRYICSIAIKRRRGKRSAPVSASSARNQGERILDFLDARTGNAGLPELFMITLLRPIPLPGSRRYSGMRLLCYALTLDTGGEGGYTPCLTGWGRSSVGRAPEWHSGGQGFDSPRLHQ